MTELNVPSRKYLIHKAVKFQACSKKVQKELVDEDTALRIGYEVQPKLDGVNCILLVQDGHAAAFSRTGERILSVGHLLLAGTELGDGAYLGELWAPELTHSEINGMSRRHKAAPALQLHVFDWIPLHDFMAGKSNLPYYRRRDVLTDAATAVGEQLELAPGIFVVMYISQEDTVAETLDVVLALPGAHDGLILRDPDAGWEAGPGKGGEILKVKRDCEFDLLCTGTTAGEGKYAGMIGALTFKWRDGRELTVGSGLTDAQRKIDTGYYNGRIFHIEAMCESSDGLLREPRIKGERFDKECADY